MHIGTFNLFRRTHNVAPPETTRRADCQERKKKKKRNLLRRNVNMRNVYNNRERSQLRVCIFTCVYLCIYVYNISNYIIK